MPGLLAVAFVAGALTILGPCSLPILPLVLGATGSGRLVRVAGVLAGFAVTFVVTTAVIAALLAAIGLTTQPLRLLAAGVFVAAGALLAWPRASDWLARQGRRPRAGTVVLGPRGDLATGLAFGAGIGLLWAPCVGPLMAGVIAAAAVEGPSGGGIAIATAYGLGAALPLALVAFGGRSLAGRMGGAVRGFRLRQGYGVLMVVAGLVVATGLDLRLQSAVASTSAGEGTALAVGSSAAPSGLPVPNDRADIVVSLDDLGPAPELTGITAWINSQPLTLASLRGKVVLVHFWTFACINCIHVQPYVKAWYEAYKDDGFVVIGVHTPELSFERDLANVRQAVADDGVTFPVAFDPAYATWNAYGNRFWPGFWFVDREGRIRHVHYGEGDDAASEAVIRALLAQR